MAWLAVDKDKSEYIYEDEPIRWKGCWDLHCNEDGDPIGGMVLLPTGTIKKLIGRELIWEDEPVELR